MTVVGGRVISGLVPTFPWAPLELVLLPLSAPCCLTLVISGMGAGSNHRCVSQRELQTSWNTGFWIKMGVPGSPDPGGAQSTILELTERHECGKTFVKVSVSVYRWRLSFQ